MLFGTAQAGTTVEVYHSADCSGELFESGSAEEFTGAGLSVAVPIDQLTTFALLARSDAGVASPCSNSLEYLHDGLSPSAGDAEVRDGAGEDIDLQNVASEVLANWNAFEDMNGIVEYEHNLSASTGCSGELAATETVALDLEAQRDGLSLPEGMVYNCVRAWDEAGNASLWKASDGLLIDTLGPQVVETSPLADATDVPRSGLLRIIFDEDIDPQSINPGTLNLKRGAQDVPGSLTIEGPRTVAFTTDEGLESQTLYTLQLSAGIQDLAGNGLRDAGTIDFTTCSSCWGKPQIVDTGSSSNSRYPAVAAAPSGRVYAVWIRQTGTSQHVFGSLLDEGAGWQSVSQIDSGSDKASDLSIAADDTGAFVVWRQQGSERDIMVSRYAQGSGWSAPMIVDSQSENAHSPRVAVDGSGNALVVWSQRANGGTKTLAWGRAYRSGGAGWGTAEILSSVAATSQQRVAMSADGTGMALWRQTGGATAYTLYAARFRPGVGWDGAQSLGAGSYGELAMDSSGNAAVLYATKDITYDSAFGAYYTAGTGWGSGVLLESEELGLARPGGIGFDASGRAIGVWYQKGSSVNSIWSSRYIPGTGWSARESVEPFTGDAYKPQVGVTASGEAIAIWEQMSMPSTPRDIFASRYVVGSGWTASPVAESSTISQNSRLAVAASGFALALWEEFDYTPSTFHLHAATFE